MFLLPFTLPSPHLLQPGLLFWKCWEVYGHYPAIDIQRHSTGGKYKHQSHIHFQMSHVCQTKHYRLDTTRDDNLQVPGFEISSNMEIIREQEERMSNGNSSLLQSPVLKENQFVVTSWVDGNWQSGTFSIMAFMTRRVLSLAATLLAERWEPQNADAHEKKKVLQRKQQETDDLVCLLWCKMRGNGQVAGFICFP